MDKSTYIDTVVDGVPKDITAGNLLFSDTALRDSWADGDDDRRAKLEALYRMAKEIQIIGDGRESLRHPSSIIAKLAREQIAYPDFHWVTWPVDSKRRHEFEITGYGRRQYHRIVSKLVPKADDIPAVEQGGGYFLLFTGPPEAVLGNPNYVKVLADFCDREPVLDVLFRKYAGSRKIMFSVRAGEGYYKESDGSNHVELFDESLDTEWFKLS